MRRCAILLGSVLVACGGRGRQQTRSPDPWFLLAGLQRQGASGGAGGGTSLHTIPMGHVPLRNSGFVFGNDPLGQAVAWSGDLHVGRVWGTPFETQRDDGELVGMGPVLSFELFELQLGADFAPTRALEPAGVGAVAGGTGLYLSMGGSFGVEALRFGPAQLGLVAYYGARYLRIDNNLDGAQAPFPCQITVSRRGQPVPQQNQCGDFDFWQGVVEPRLVLDVMMTESAAPTGYEGLVMSFWLGTDVVPLPLPGGFAAGLTLYWMNVAGEEPPKAVFPESADGL